MTDHDPDRAANLLAAAQAADRAREACAAFNATVAQAREAGALIKLGVRHGVVSGTGMSSVSVEIEASVPV